MHVSKTESSGSNKAPRAKKGTVQIKVSNDRLQLVFSRQGQRYYLSTGLAESPVNRKAAERKAKQIELDLVSGNFDPSLNKYKPTSFLKTQRPDITPKITPKLQDL
jgi:hypothetical protein